MLLGTVHFLAVPRVDHEAVDAGDEMMRLGVPMLRIIRPWFCGVHSGMRALRFF